MQSTPQLPYVKRWTARLDSGTNCLYNRSIEIILANQATSGAFIASPTFSQYKYSWFRDGSFISTALDHTKRADMLPATEKFHMWVAKVIRKYSSVAEGAITKVNAGISLNVKEDVLHCRYDVDGSPAREEWSAFQIDGFGTWLYAFNEHLKRLDPVLRSHKADEYMDVISLLVRYLSALWKLPNADCWEEHTDKIATSTLAALYGGLSSVSDIVGYHKSDRGESVANLATSTANDIKSYILTHAVATDSATSLPYFTKFCGGADPGVLRTAVDANLLWIAHPYNLVPPDHPAMVGTVSRIMREIMQDRPHGSCGLQRYAEDEYYGGGEWILLTASLACVLAHSGRADGLEAAMKFKDWIEEQALEDGALPEQVLNFTNHPHRVDYWRQKWGEVATPLLWSHANYLSLVDELRSRNCGLFNVSEVCLPTVSTPNLTISADSPFQSPAPLRSAMPTPAAGL